MFCGWTFLERFLTLAEGEKLYSCIQACYGELEENEKKYFSLIVLFNRCGVLEWSVREVRQALHDNDWQREQRFRTILMGTIREINEIYRRIPQLTRLLQKLDSEPL